MITQYRQQKYPPGFILFCSLAFLIITKSLVMRLTLPHVALMDADIKGYLNPALDFLGGGRLSADRDRGLYYQLFILLCIAVGRGISAVAFYQHMLSMIGLVLMTKALWETFDKGNELIKMVIILVGLIMIGWNREIIFLEHTIRRRD